MAKNKVGGKTTFLIAAFISAAILAASVFITISSLNAKTTYWVVSEDIAPRQRVTSSMLVEKEARSGSEPEAALTAAFVDSNEVYAKYALKPGDILTRSNVGPLVPITVGIPEDYSVSSFTASATSAAIGQAKRGDYIDIYATYNEGNIATTKLILQRVLVLDSVDGLDEVNTRASANTGPDSGTGAEPPKGVSRVSSIYQVGLSRDDTAVLANITSDSRFRLFVALSPAKGASSPIPEKVSSEELINSIPGDSGEGTDPTFGVKEEPADNQNQPAELKVS